MRSSFREAGAAEPEIVVTCDFGDEDDKTDFRLREPASENAIANWEFIERANELSKLQRKLAKFSQILSELKESEKPSLEELDHLSTQQAKLVGRVYFHDFVIYSANILALRGLEVISRREPLGIHGEGLDTLLGTLDEDEFAAVDGAMQCIRWVKNIELDREGERRFQGFKLGRSRSNLYFVDRFMADENNVFSAESVNEGALYVLFYLALFSTKHTPPLFGVDNIDTALNPQLCRDLIKQLANLAKKTDKQALITTHNPAILDGMNLRDDDQRLFVVYRTDEGYTRTRRIKVKPDAPEPLKLSELWMRGFLGGLPEGF